MGDRGRGLRQRLQVPALAADAGTSATSWRSPAGRRSRPTAAAPAPTLWPPPRRSLAWKRRSCGDGAKGPRLFDWAVATLPDTGTAEHGFSRWLLIRQSISNPRERAYYLCYGPDDTDDEELIRVAGARWAVEECFQTAKGQVGLDEYQVRRYDAWYRHITLAMCAHAYLAVTAAGPKRGHFDRPGLVPISLAETRRLLAHLITRRPDPRPHPSMVIMATTTPVPG